MRGYTLIELLITLTIIGLLFGFGFVNFRDYSRRQHLASVATGVKGDLRLAQEKALSGEMPNGCTGLSAYSLKISTYGYQVLASCFGEITVKSVSFPTGISASATVSPISFKVLGHGTNIPAGSQAAVTLTQIETGQTTTVTVTSGGEIR